MRAVTFTFCGTKYGLYLSGAVLFDIEDKYGGLEAVFELLRGRSREKLDSLADVIELLSSGFRAARNALGYDPPPVLTAAIVKAAVSVRDIHALQIIVATAINEGMRQEEGDEDVDLGLLEFQKKTDKPSSTLRSTS